MDVYIHRHDVYLYFNPIVAAINAVIAIDNFSCFCLFKSFTFGLHLEVLIPRFVLRDHFWWAWDTLFAAGD